LSVIPFLSLFVISLFIQSLIVRDIFIFASLLIISELFYSFLPLKNKLYHLRSFKFIILSLIYAVLFGILAGLYLPHSNLPLFLSALIILLSSVSEALYFQGLIQNAVCNLINPITGVIFTIILYGFFHSTTNNEQLIIIILYGLCGTLLYFFWKNIYLVMIFYLLFQITFYFISHNILFF
jgi:membrane protease YdiL (CAAX protease family)